MRLRRFSSRCSTLLLEATVAFTIGFEVLGSATAGTASDSTTIMTIAAAAIVLVLVLTVTTSVSS